MNQNTHTDTQTHKHEQMRRTTQVVFRVLNRDQIKKIECLNDSFEMMSEAFTSSINKYV